VSNQPGGFDTRGVVDLGALAAAREAQAKAQQHVEQDREAGVQVPLVFAATEETFAVDVSERSHVVPVVIDFWAPWCEPCKQLSPILEKLVAEADGRWLLAKVDVDQQPRIGQAFGVQGIPALFAIVAGQPLPLFQGALPEEQIRQVLEQLMTVAAEAGVNGQITGGVIPEATEEVEQDVVITDPELDDAADAIDRGDLAAAVTAYEALLQREPFQIDGKAGLATVKLMQRTQGIELVAALNAAVHSPQDIDAHLVAADVLVLHARANEAFELLVDLVRRTDDAERATVRTHLVELFDLLGNDHPAVPAGRLALSNALF
jgi:putative thioredoxin